MARQIEDRGLLQEGAMPGPRHGSGNGKIRSGTGKAECRPRSRV